jgi:hypothetical protein
MVAASHGIFTKEDRQNIWGKFWHGDKGEESWQALRKKCTALAAQSQVDLPSCLSLRRGKEGRNSR